MASKSFAEFYHQETKYSPKGLSRNQRQIDWTKQPVPFKEYKKGKSVELAKYISKRDFVPDENSVQDKNLENLAKLLYYTNGVTALIPYSTPLLLRAAPSAGGLYPTEIYVIANGYEGLDDGVYNFQVKNHSLVEFWDKSIWNDLKSACFDHPSFEKSSLCIVLTGVFYRSSWRYEDRAYRRILLDTGHVIGNLTTYAPFVKKHTNLIGGFNDDKVNDLLWLDKNEESALAVITLSDELLQEAEPKTLPSKIQKDEHNIIDLLLSFHNSGRIDNFIPPVPTVEKPAAEQVAKFSLAFGEPINLNTIDWEKKLEATILERRSTRAFSGDPLTRDELGKLLSFTYNPEMYQEQGFGKSSEFFDLSLIETYIAVTDVDGLEDGCYYYSVSKKELKQIRFKNFREEICYLCLGQELGRDAGAVFFHTINLPKAVAKYGERAYRYLHMDAGNLGQRLNLACMKMGLGVSGIGGFFDDQVNELLGIPESEAVLYITTIGRPFTD